MNDNEIHEWVKVYREYMNTEFDAIRHVAVAEVEALDAADLDGKNAEERAFKHDKALYESDAYQEAIAERDRAIADRKAMEMEGKMLIEWLHSLRGDV